MWTAFFLPWWYFFPPRNLISCPSCRHDFQFFNIQRLTELYEKEVRYLMVRLFKWNTCHCFDVHKREFTTSKMNLLLFGFSKHIRKISWKTQLRKKNQKVKLRFSFFAHFANILFQRTYYWLRIFLWPGGDPLTAEEVEEKEALLEEVKWKLFDVKGVLDISFVGLY